MLENMGVEAVVLSGKRLGVAEMFWDDAGTCSMIKFMLWIWLPIERFFAQWEYIDYEDRNFNLLTCLVFTFDSGRNGVLKYTKQAMLFRQCPHDDHMVPSL